MASDSTHFKPPAETVRLKSVDLNLVIETPENVVLSYQLAGPSIRLAAYLVDLLVRVTICIVASIFLLVISLGVGGFSIGLMLVLWFVLEWGYFVFSEGFFRGKTIGKHAFNLRVIQEGGYPISLWSALLRNLLRGADCLPPPFLYGVGFFGMLAAGNFRRLGDVVARTVVIQENVVTLPVEPVILEKIQPFPRTEIGGYIPAARTLSLIEQFLGRRHVLTFQRGHEMSLVLARVLAQRLNFRGDPSFVEQYPMAFLARVYATFHRVHEPHEDEGWTQRKQVAAAQPAPVGAGV